MEAKDTVIEHSHEDCYKCALEQAEISFKAGIKEVVEWLDKGCGHFDRDWCFISGLCEECWHAKLKDWDIH